MDTFKDTLTNENYEQILRDLPSDPRDLSLLHEAGRIWEGFIDYHSFPTSFDCIENDTELMEGFFGWLDEVVLRLEHVKNACLYYLINSPDDKRKKEETGKELNRLDAFCRDFAWHKQFIAEKAFYFEGFLESLHGRSKNIEGRELLTPKGKEVKKRIP